MTKVIRMMASDREEVVVEEAVAMKSQMIRDMIEDNCAEDVINISDVTASVLSKVFQYCEKHLDDSLSNDELKDFDSEFVDVDVDNLYDLITAASYLDVKDLLDLVCQKVADMIRGKSPDEIRQTFEIESDLTPEEEEEIREQNSWAFESTEN